MHPFGDIKQIVPAGLDAILLYFAGDTVDIANARCQQWQHAISNLKLPWLKECVPAYDSLLLSFDAYKVDSHYVYQMLRSLAAQETTMSKRNACADSGKAHEIPVWYGAETANDLALVGQKTGLSEQSIIDAHSSMTYKVYAVGFAPGFAYMGNVPEALNCARLETPRKQVPKGAVAIADAQTAIYPSSSPGGWHLLGLCPLNLIDTSHNALLKVGDNVTFAPISEQEFRDLHEG
ncbi:allophanate hydrolase subunit 1 [Alteromonas sp. 1_MG-2023]|uniref:5-oxoprolinase subunit B family protein n=1 Tax=Alteromonas sp. 1_MG-2023 TaxID=3062669 RepID=UPI0026E182BC|nr:allophanate hydrolase subunit 1 [Alteromonas sp. 1_MG-2023]MDO6568058.1 allophanate hydrolase subunit 1 [Alteromonas sp. 1_MG-2023]